MSDRPDIHGDAEPDEGGTGAESEQPAMAAEPPGDSSALGPECPSCHEPWLRATSLAGRYRCVYCLRRFELRSECPDCGQHSTIARMSDTENLICRNCGGSMLRPI